MTFLTVTFETHISQRSLIEFVASSDICRKRYLSELLISIENPHPHFNMSTLSDLYDRAIANQAIDDSSTTEANTATPSSSNPGDTEDIIESKGALLDLIDLTVRDRPGAENPSIAPTSHFKRPRAQFDLYSEYALRVMRKVDKDGNDAGKKEISLEISSPVIQGVIRRVMASYAFLNLGADPIVIPHPFAPMFHYRKELKDVASSSKSEIERLHMQFLMDKFMRPYLSETERIFDDEVPTGKVRFEYLWTLFRAEDEVIKHTNHYREAHRVMHYEVLAADGSECFYLYTWRWGYNAGKFGPCSETIMIPKFSSTRRIEQLPCFPIKYLGTAERIQMCKDLVERGKTWRELIKPSHRMYTGKIVCLSQ